MAEELGRIERPAAAEFEAARKLLLVPLFFAYAEAPADYLERLESYWAEVREQLERLSQQLGSIDKVFHEMVFASGDAGVAMLEGISRGTHRIVKTTCQQGATLVATEDAELLQEALDWQRCLWAGLSSAKVTRYVADAYREASRHRYDHIARVIDEALGGAEVGVVFVGEGQSIQFPADIQVFYVAPPSLNDVHRWLRDRPATAEPEAG